MREYKLNDSTPSRDDLVVRLTKANAQLDVRIQGLAPQYTKPLLSNVRDPQKIARSLSKKYPNFEFLVGYRSGEQALTAKPIGVQFGSVDVSDRELWTIVERAEEVVVSLDTAWPSYNELVAYADGYAVALGARDEEVEALKQENDRLRYAKDMPPFGWPLSGYRR